MPLKPPISPTSAVPSAGLASAPRIVQGGNLGSTYALDVDEDVWVWLVGTLTANVTITFSDEVAGSSILLLLTQDGTGGRTVSVSDGSTTTAVTVGSNAGELTAVRIDCTSTSAYKAYSLRGTDGADGATGVPGTALGVLGVDLWDTEADPGAVTDWGPMIETLVAAGVKRILLREETFPHNGIDLTGYRGIVFEGVAAVTWIDHNPAPDAAILSYTGTGSGTAIDLGSTDGIVFKDVELSYSSSSFTGTLIDLNFDGGGAAMTALPIFERCRIGGKARMTAAQLVRTGDSVMPIFRDCAIGGSQIGILGYESGTGVPGNDMIADGCVFSFCEVFLMNPGINWRFRDCTFEFSSPDTNFCVDSDFTFAGSQYSDITFDNCTWWDAADAAQAPVKQRAGHPMSLIVRGGFASSFTPVHFEMLGPGIVIIDGMKFARAVHPSSDALIDLGTSAGSAQKTAVRIVGNSFFASDNTGLPAIDNIDGGHKNIEISGNAPGGQREIHTVYGQVRNGYEGGAAARPTVAVAAGQPALTIIVRGNDHKGYVAIINQSGGATNAGDLLDFTLGKGLVIGEGGGFAANERVVHVTLTPASGLNASAVGADSVNLGAFVKGTESTTAWTLATVNTLANNGRAGWFYEVTAL